MRLKKLLAMHDEAERGYRALSELADDWDHKAKIRRERADQLGDIRAGLAFATEAGCYGNCAADLRIVISETRTPR